MKTPNFTKSDIGAQAAWKGFSSQTLYIAHRLFSDDGSYEYYPEDIEDLVIKKDGIVIEADYFSKLAFYEKRIERLVNPMYSNQ